jgi:universal stress protein A
MTTFNRILVPIDFGAASDTALARAKELAACLGARIRLLHVVEDSRAVAHWTPEVYVGVSPGLAASLMADAETRLKTLVTTEECERFGIVFEVRVGNAPDAIESVARSEGIDLIVMGTHGRRGLAHMFLGSVAERVVRTAPCAVLTTQAAPKGAGLAAQPVYA